MKTLYLIDGYAQFFRNYHAIRTPMTSPVTREPTNMTFGFVGMLLKLLRGGGVLGEEDGGADYVAVALDVSGDKGTFRTRLYPDYKATRDAPPEDLFPQVERCLGLLEAIGVPSIGAEGFEADDVIATIVDRLRETDPDVLVRIVSKDKDLKQLLEPVGSRPGAAGGVEMADVHQDQIIDADTLREETGLSPAQVVDMLALMGDTADNIPGVPGIGPKTAAKLIAEFGSLDDIIAQAGTIKGKRGENIRAFIDRFPLTRELVTLRRDVDIAFDLDRARTDQLKLTALGPILRELGFNRYQDELKALLGQSAGGRGGQPPAGETQPAIGPSSGGLFDSITPPSTMPVSGSYHCVTTQQELDALVQTLKGADLIAVDTETTALSPLRAKLCGLSFAVEPGEAWYVPVRSPAPAEHLDEQTVLDALRTVLEDPQLPKTGHNLKYDLLILRNHGVELRGLTDPSRDPSESSDEGPDWLGCDTMVASYLIDSSRSSHSLDALAQALLGRQNVSIKELIGTGKKQRTFDEVPLDLAAPYAAEDADVSLQLHREMMPQLRAMGLSALWRDVELPLVEVLAELEWNGILVDPDELSRQERRLQKRIDELTDQIRDAAMESPGRAFNPDSPRQLAAILFNAPDDDRAGVSGGPGLGIKPIKRTKTGFSTDNEVLDKLDADPAVDTPIPALMLEYRQLTKLVGTYLKALHDEINPKTGRIHASFNQTGAVTGRLSSSDPNLQNIPIRTDIGREIRKAFIAPPGRVLISADYSQIELRILAHLSRDPALIEAFHAGQDIHAAVAAQIHGVPIDQVTRAQRNGAKMVNFGIVYGITPFGLARRLGCSNTEAEGIIDGYKRRFAGITTFLEECIEQARRLGYVETMLKRRRFIHDIDSTNPRRRAMAQRVAINSVVQGSAADLIKIAMVDLHDLFSEHACCGESGMRTWEVQMLLQIHDELVFESPESRAEAARGLIVERMEGAMSLTVPLRVDAAIAFNWHEGH
jgi:DNA polymerase-1